MATYPWRAHTLHQCSPTGVAESLSSSPGTHFLTPLYPSAIGGSWQPC